MKYEKLMRQPAIVSGSLGQFPKTIAEFMQYRKANPNVAMVIGANTYQAVMADYANFSPSEKHQDLKDGKLGRYRGFDLYSDVYREEGHFLEVTSVKLVRTTEEPAK